MSVLERSPKEKVELPIKNVDEEKEVKERLTENAVEDILPARYFLKDKKGNVTEDAAGMFQRVAENVAAGENDVEEEKIWEQEFYKQMAELRFIPNSPTLMNAGTDMNQLSACFVLEPKDDMEHIFESAKNAALIFQSGGGVGYDFSKLRANGKLINSTGGIASGPVSFMRVFDETCNQVKQGGKRRGAQMGILRVDHPDIARFVCAKRQEGELSNFNISVAYTDEFENALKNGEDYTLYEREGDVCTVCRETEKFYNFEYKDNPKDAYADGEGETVSENLWRDYADSIRTVDGQTLEEKWAGEIQLEEGEEMSLPASFIWDIVIDGAWRNGEPGFFHLDETNREHSFDVEEYPKHIINATNPCAEQPLSEFEACNLGHINCSLLVKQGTPSYKDFDGTVEKYCDQALDFENLDRTIQAGVRFLDNVVTQSNFPIEKIEERVSNQRKIGLGIMGFAQMLYQMEIPYGSEESIQVARYFMRYVDRKATLASHFIAREKNPFGYWNESKYSDPQKYSEWFESHTGLPAEDYPDGFKIRNHNVTTIAPTGTTSKIGNTSGGCEPVYNVANYANVGTDIQGGSLMVEFDDYFIQTLEHNDIDVEEIKQEAKELMENNKFENINQLSVPDKLKEVFVTTQEVEPEEHGRIQRAFQEFCDSGISKTINLPNEATRDDVDSAYMLAMNENEVGANIKGLTVYRDGSRQEQVLTTRKDNQIEEDDEQGKSSSQQIEPDGDMNDMDPCPTEGCEGQIEKTDDCALCPVCWQSPCD